MSHFKSVLAYRLHSRLVSQGAQARIPIASIFFFRALRSVVLDTCLRVKSRLGLLSTHMQGRWAIKRDLEMKNGEYVADM